MIISCSRRTDIPAFYSDWFFNRLQEGYVCVRNPRNARQVRRVPLAPADVDCFVFWTKNPTPMLDRLHLLQDYPYYFQLTLTPYGGDIEPHLPAKTKITDAFLRLSDSIGAQRVIWRYDPILLSGDIGIDDHLDLFGKMASRLSGYTKKCIISFIDMYRHIENRMSNLSVRPPDEAQMRMLAAGIARIAKSAGMTVETCAEEIDLADLGIEHGGCIDPRLISAITGKHLTVAKDKHQRWLCGCAASVDIGEYNTCAHQCRYCYANVHMKKIDKNCALHNDRSVLLIGEIGDR